MVPDDAFYEKKMTCIYCSSPFVTQKVRSRFSVPYKIDSDFCPHFREGNYNPHYYFVNVCPECGFAFSEEFSDHFPVGTKEAIKLGIANKWTKRDFGQFRESKQAIETYKLAILAGSLKKEKNAVLAGLSLRLAWLYRAEGIFDQEKRFLALALQSYEESFLYSDFTGTSMSELRVLFMVGELSRRLGQPEKAIAYFSKIIQHKEANEEPKIVNLARKQWQEMIEEKRRKKD
ncbi:hypothetical protein Desor_0650 [Desulfosporosinus orientis DSM 765]|uniref:DUF2225 domain-containing protein n=1 Tax=Desulfosporosinus orientis (strain ATCC 19365 / DSM 765 / NCIMB 8382 / VKM B-1628 / Singapore I) TaxID=768706 RepID=G7W5B5_DESOD|nr:DUF2225 domain-containing protein [Desulfosporosinus orientis]AET66343.1 hypothetical protein Desor_0650 [Desulfosporosinus orientis DSM 765]